MRNRFIPALAVILAMAMSVAAAEEWQPSTQWAKGKTIRFFVGGDPGDVFGSIVYRGAQQAALDTGANVEYVFSGWDMERMASQFREAVAARPDAIAMMGHAGDAALMPIAKQAIDAGIKLMWQNTDVPGVRKELGSGFVGVIDQDRQGRDLAREAMRTLNLAPGGVILVFGDWGEPGREVRELGTADEFEKAGFKVVKIKVQPAWSADLNLATPTVSGSILANPDAVLMVLPGGQMLGAAPIYLRAANKKPGDIKVIGTDVSPEIVRAIGNGFIQITSDQQPYLQGYLPVLSLCQQMMYDLAPLTVDTGNGFVTSENYERVKDLAAQGLR